MLLAGMVIIWQDTASANVFEHLHKLFVIHPVLTEAEVKSIGFYLVKEQNTCDELHSV